MHPGLLNFSPYVSAIKIIIVLVGHFTVHLYILTIQLGIILPVSEQKFVLKFPFKDVMTKCWPLNVPQHFF